LKFSSEPDPLEIPLTTAPDVPRVNESDLPDKTKSDCKEAKQQHKIAAGNAKTKNRLELIDRLEKFFSNCCNKVTDIRGQFSDWQIKRAEAKAKTKAEVQRARAEKWRQFGKAVPRVFVALHNQRNAKIKTEINRSLWMCLVLFFLTLTLFGVIISSVWIKAFAPVALLYSLFWPVITKKGFPALVAKTVIILPSIIWMCVWFVVRFK
jgi:hypothetical protein